MKSGSHALSRSARARRKLSATANRIRWAWSDFRFRRAGLFCVHVDSAREGLFAQLSSVMGLLQNCDRLGLKPHIVLSGQLYLDAARGPNFLDYFFDGPTYSARELALINRQPIREVKAFAKIGSWRRNDFPRLADSLRLFERYYSAKTDLTAEVDTFANQFFVPGRTLAIHYRGTDKWTEASEAQFEETVRDIRQCLKVYPRLDRLFVATDSQPYLDFIIQAMRPLEVICQTRALRSSNQDSVHLSAVGNGYQKGRDALIDCLLLSRCDVMVKTMSNLSGWAKVFNPAMRVYLMNRPAKQGIDWLGFPEHEMVEREWFASALHGPSVP